MKMGRLAEVVAVAMMGLVSVSVVAQSDFASWPKGYDPKEVGKFVAEHFVVTPHQDPKRIIYPEVCAWYGALTFAQLSGDKELTQKLVHRFDPLMGPQEAALLPPAGQHVDFSIFGALPLELSMQTKDDKYKTLGLKYADLEWAKPDANGLSDETRFWIDDMYMVTLVQVQAYRATGDKKYLDRAAVEMTAYLDKLQKPNGLFQHALDVPFFWGRGDGWVAAGMAELLRDLPKDHPQRARILSGYKLMMAALLKTQGKDGMWRQLIDHDESWPEASSTGMFTFAMVTGVKSGWLDGASYGPAARKAWIGLVGYVDQHGDVTNVCEGTNKLNSYDYYMTRKRKTGDFHGQAPVLWAASAFLR